MRIISRSTLRLFWEKHPDAEQPLRAWHAEAERARWEDPSDIKAQYQTASFLAGNRVVFNIKGNTYRLIVAIKFKPFYVVYVRFVGTHREYDRVDAATV